MAADRRVDPAGGLRQLGQQHLVEHFPHAVQALKFIVRDPARILDHARDGERIVGGELRIEPRPRRQQPVGTSQVGQIGHRLAGEDRIVCEPALLRALDLAVPIGALHQPHHQAAAARLGGLGQPVDHGAGALLIGLHRQAESIPAAQRRVGQHRRDHLERELEPVGFFRIHREVEVMVARLSGEHDDVRHQLGEHARPRHRLEARMQRRQLDRDAGPVRQRVVAGPGPDGVDRRRIGGQIARRILRGAGAFAQHVEGVAPARRPGAAQRLLDGLPEHEMGAQEPHRLAGRGAHHRQAEPPDEALEDGVGRLGRMDDAGGDAQRPGGGGNQERARFAARRTTNRRSRACPRSAGRRWRHPAPAAAPPPAPSGRGPPWWTANRRAGNPRSRRDRRCGAGSPRSGRWRADRCALRPAPDAPPAPANARRSPHRAARRAPETGPIEGGPLNERSASAPAAG